MWSCYVMHIELNNEMRRMADTFPSPLIACDHVYTSDYVQIANTTSNKTKLESASKT